MSTLQDVKEDFAVQLMGNVLRKQLNLEHLKYF